MKELLDHASKKYYEGSPIMSDESFDAIAEEFNYSRVGSVQEPGSIALPFQLYSLQKMYYGDPPIKLPEPTIGSPKLDGAAIAIIYIYGNLSLALTRGDGVRGKDITENISSLEGVPKYIKVRDHEPVVQIVGEIVAPITIKNSRNYAAGALGLKDSKEFIERDLTFIAYDIFPKAYPSWAEDINSLVAMGFNTVLQSDWSEFPKDGVVFRVDDNETFESLGYTNKHPRGAFALKTRKAGVITTLESVEWQVGRSGIVSPVAILTPIDIDGAKVSRATLHNIKYIEELNLELGCQVEVIRSGEIIPRVVRRVE